MPVWYPVSTLLLCTETWLLWHTPQRNLLLIAAAIWVLTSLASILFLVPLNTRLAKVLLIWQQTHRTWDRRHRIRVVALASAAALLTYAVVR